METSKLSVRCRARNNLDMLLELMDRDTQAAIYENYAQDICRPTAGKNLEWIAAEERDLMPT